MTGLHRRTGRSIRLVRTAIEVAVRGTGFVLGGTVGVGTVALRAGHRPARPALPARVRRPRSASAAARSSPRGHTGAGDTAAVTTLDTPPLPRPSRPARLRPPGRGGGRPGEHRGRVPRGRSSLGYRYIETDVHATRRRQAGRLPRRDAGPDDRRARPDRASCPGREVRAGAGGGQGAAAALRGAARGRSPSARWNIDIKAEPALRPAARPDRAGRTPGTGCASARSPRPGWPAPSASPGPRLATSYGVRGVLRPAAALVRASRRRCAAARSCAQVPETPVGHPGGGPALRAGGPRARAAGPRVDGERTGSDAALLDLGVDGIMTDHIETLRKVLSDRGAWV